MIANVDISSRMSTFHREYLIATRYLIANRELQYELRARNELRAPHDESVSRVERRPDRRAPRRPRDALAMGVFAKKKRTPAELAVKLLNSLNSLGGGGGGEKARPRPSPRRPLDRGRASSDDRNNERSLSRVDRSFTRVVNGETRREKSLRIGVHHANAVVWEPVYRSNATDDGSSMDRSND